MDKVSVKIKSIVPLLMNRYKMENDEAKTKRRDEKFDPKDDADAAMYYDEKIGVYAPSTWIEASIREAAKEFKGKGRGSLKATILSSVFVDPEKIPLGKSTYDEIDQRPAVIQRNRIVKSRPKFNSWELNFTISFNNERIRKENLKDILVEAGQTKGIGDYRPKFGRFEVVQFE